jgi:hypothetical protein
MRAVDLDQLPETGTPLPDLEHAPGPPAPRLPQPQTDLDLPHGLGRHRDPLVLAELLRSQRGTEVRIAIAQGRLDPADHAPQQTIVRRLASAPRHQPPIPATPVRRHQSLDLTNPDPQQLRRAPLPQLPIHHLPDHMRPPALLRAHPKHVPVHPPPSRQQKGDISTLQEGDI